MCLCWCVVKSSPFTLRRLYHTSQGRLCVCLTSCQREAEGYRKGVRAESQPDTTWSLGLWNMIQSLIINTLERAWKWETLSWIPTVIQTNRHWFNRDLSNCVNSSTFWGISLFAFLLRVRYDNTLMSEMFLASQQLHCNIKQGQILRHDTRKSCINGKIDTTHVYKVNMNLQSAAG